MAHPFTDLPRHFLSFSPAEPLSGREIFLIICTSVAWVVLFMFEPSIAMILLLFVTIGFFSAHLFGGLLLLSTIIFFHGWEIDFSRYQWALDLPFLPSVNAPIGHIASLILFLSFLLALFFKRQTLRPLLKEKKIVLAATVFLCASAASLLFALEPLFAGVSWYEIARWRLFPIVAFGFLPLLIIRDQVQLEKIIEVLVGVGILAALFGLSSFFMVVQPGWGRVVPYGFFGIAPFGYNHNLLAEPLVAIVPYAIWLSIRRQSTSWFLAALLILFACLLTLSRAAWLSLAVSAVYAWWYLERKAGEHPAARFKRAIQNPLVIMTASVIGVAVLAYMAIFLSSASVVKSSTASRFDAVTVVWYYAHQRPFLGFGPGSFLPLFEDTAVYVLDYGQPLDGHGFIQKILLEQGFIGLGAFVILLGTFFFRAHLSLRALTAEKRVFLLCLSASACGAVIFQLFNTSYFNANMWYPLGLLLAGSVVLRYE